MNVAREQQIETLNKALAKVERFLSRRLYRRHAVPQTRSSV
jgi:hypothetical protein